MKTVTEFNSSVIVVTKMITYKFLRGFLHSMHDRSHLAMVVFTKRFWLLANFYYLSLVPAKVIAR